MYIGSLGKCVSFDYTLRKDTFSLRGWLFWYWWISFKKIDVNDNSYGVGIRVLGFAVQRIGR